MTQGEKYTQPTAVLRTVIVQHRVEHEREQPSEHQEAAAVQITGNVHHSDGEYVCALCLLGDMYM